ncbi:sugar ABC transporter permease [Pseudokineococcus basanitobsidens]|uniref:Sugar ABC transporter permease n=1 Tax=Pseudokineococcus basanitobsidens TaxID=1926649 RepID=A0ABU8RPG3_9ACTN
MPTSPPAAAEAAAEPAAAAAAPVRARSPRGRATPYLFLAPALVVYGAFLLFPLARAVQFSFYDYDGLTVGTFVGLRNYAAVLTDEGLREAFGHALVLIAFFALLPLLIGFVLAALLVRSRVRGLPLFRTVVFLPQVIAMVVVAVAWRRIYAPDGTLNELLRGVGLDGLARTWLGDYATALPAVGVIGTWYSTGLVTVLLMAGMARVPKELYEAASLDGASPARQLRALTLPAIRPEIAVALTLTIIAALKTFDLVYVTTGGGPGTSTTVPSYEVYRRAFELGEVGAAAAVGVVLTVLIFGINLVVNRVADRSR